MRLFPRAVRLALAAIVVQMALVPGAGAQTGHDEEEHDDGHGLVVFSEADQKEFGIQTEVAAPGTIYSRINLPGEIHPNDDMLAHLVPRYDGIVTDVRARLGDQVSMGQVLAIIESDQSLAPYPLKTSIAGTVIEKHITLGEAASRDRVPFVVADLSTVWLDLYVSQRDIHAVHEGQTVAVNQGRTVWPIKGTIQYVAPVLDERSRTATARVVLDNAEGHWLPGMFVTATVQTGETLVPVAVPRSALFTMHGETVLFVAEDGGFEVRHVVTGRQDEFRLEITRGLQPDEVFVSQGGFTVKAEFEKTTFGDGHNH
jgi:cobalt-zinc-cadmium efflux system membrane fusion protein